MENNREINILYFNTRDEMLRVDLRKVLYFKADRNYTDVYFVNGVHVTLPTGLMSIEQMLENDKLRGRTMPFVRLGRSLIVNIIVYIAHQCVETRTDVERYDDARMPKNNGSERSTEKVKRIV